MTTKLMAIVESALEQAGIPCEKAEENMVWVKLRGCGVQIAVDADGDNVQIHGFVPCLLADMSYAEACVRVNKWNMQHLVKCFVDEAGDLHALRWLDATEGPFNERMLLMGLAHVADALSHAARGVQDTGNEEKDRSVESVQGGC